MLCGIFVGGLVILWTACPLKWEYCPHVSVPLRELDFGQRQKTHWCCSFCSFFYGEEKKIFIYKHRLSFLFFSFFFWSGLNLSAFLLSHLLSFFFLFFSFTPYHKQCSKYTTPWREKRRLNWCFFFFGHGPTWKLFHTRMESRVWGARLSEPGSCCRLMQLRTWTHTSRAESVPKSSTYFNIGHIQILTATFLIRCMFLYIVHKATNSQPRWFASDVCFYPFSYTATVDWHGIKMCFPWIWNSSPLPLSLYVGPCCSFELNWEV